jgi:hypothetical protein
MKILNVLKANKMGILKKSLIVLGAAAGLVIVYKTVKTNGSDEPETQEFDEETSDNTDEATEEC